MDYAGLFSRSLKEGIMAGLTDTGQAKVSERLVGKTSGASPAVSAGITRQFAASQPWLSAN